MKVLTGLFLVFCVLIFWTATDAYSDMDCVHVQYYCYDATTWDHNNPKVKEAYDTKATAVFLDDWNFEGVIFDENSTLGSNKYTATQYKDIFDGKYVGVVVAHGDDSVVAVEYFPYTELGRISAFQSATAQDFYDPSTGWDSALLYTVSNSSGVKVCYTIGVDKEAFAMQPISEPRGQELGR